MLKSPQKGGRGNRGRLLLRGQLEVGGYLARRKPGKRHPRVRDLKGACVDEGTSGVNIKIGVLREDDAGGKFPLARIPEARPAVKGNGWVRLPDALDYPNSQRLERVAKL